MTETPALFLSLHGPALTRDAQGQVRPLERLAAGLCALAALEPHMTRERAALWLWPDSDDPRRNLRQQLLRFKRIWGMPLLVGEAVLTLAPGVVLLPAPPGAELLQGEPVDGSEFGQWLAQRRQQEADAHRSQLLRQLAHAEAQDDLDTALALARSLVQLDAADESHHAALMRVHYLRAEPAAGLQAWQQLQDAVRLHAGSRPAASSEALAAALRQMGAAPQPPALSKPAAWPVTLKRPPQLAGRRAESAALDRAWADGRAVLLLGEAGMGKSRLLADTLALRPGVLQAAGRPGDSGAPYSTLARLLRPLTQALPPGLDARFRAALAHLAASNSSEPSPPQPALQPGVLQAAVGALLDHAGIQAVALDDLHFADGATLELLAGLASQDSARRWLFAQRPAEAPPAAQALQDGLSELNRLAVVPLAPLDEAATAQLVDGLGIHGLQGPALAPALVRHSGGNPLFLLETLKLGLADGSLVRGELPRPATVGTLIDRRLQRLSEGALNLARVAAIAGVDFRIELAESALAQPAMQLASAWHELQQAQVLRDEAFAHDLVADAVLRGVPRAVARRVHAQCASWLQAHEGEPARVARHWREGGHPLEAARAYEQAARRARATARQAEEAELQGLAAAAYADAGCARERFEALASRVSALIGARSDVAAVAEARTLAQHATDDLQRVRAARVLADLLGQRGPFDEAIAVGREGLALAREVGAQDELVRLSGLTAGNLCKTGAANDAYSLLLPLREWVDGCEDDSLRHIWYGYWAATLGHIGRLREGVAAYDTAAAAAQRLGDRPGQSMALLNQCVVLRTMGALDRACEGSRRGLALAPEGSDNASHQLAQLMHARNQAESGQYASALASLEELLPQFESMGAPFWVWAARGTLARLWQHLGQHARALQALSGPPAEGLPAWMHAGLRWTELEVAQWRAQRVEEPQVQHALALLEGDSNRRVANQVRGLRFLAPAAVLAQAPGLAEKARQCEQFGVLAALHLHEARAATSAADTARAAQAAQALAGLLDEGYAPDFAYPPEAWLAAADAATLGQQPALAARAQAAGLAWVQARALPHVPAPFLDSFLQRNPVNRLLWARADAQAPRAAAGP